jgi:hypothetical protein
MSMKSFFLALFLAPFVCLGQTEKAEPPSKPGITIRVHAVPDSVAKRERAYAHERKMIALRSEVGSISDIDNLPNATKAEKDSLKQQVARENPEKVILDAARKKAEAKNKGKK